MVQALAVVAVPLSVLRCWHFMYINFLNFLIDWHVHARMGGGGVAMAVQPLLVVLLLLAAAVHEHVYLEAATN